MSATGEVNPGRQQFRRLVERKMRSVRRQANGDEFRFGSRVEDADRIGPSQTMVVRRDTHDRAAKFLDVADCALVLWTQ